MIGKMEWSATGRAGASLAEYSASRDVAFAFARAQSRLKEMQGIAYKQKRVEFLATDGSQTVLSRKSMFVVCSNRTVLSILIFLSVATCYY